MINSWIHHYQLFLFDFDGILVDTEKLHYQAYIKMCADRGFSLKWDERTYIRHAMFSATGLKEGIYREFPDLYRFEPCWDVLYREKKKAYYNLLVQQNVSLMPGVEELLAALEKANIKRCVVTHSLSEQTDVICEQLPILKSIPKWITRDDYENPKPSPECYLKAIGMLKQSGDRIIGFEDSPRGLCALLGTEAKAVLISNYFEPDEVQHLSEQAGKEFQHVSSFIELQNPTEVG